MVDTLRIKRRLAGGAAGAPSSLKNAELAFNEQDNTLYYGKGDSGGNATSVIAVGGSGAFAAKAGVTNGSNAAAGEIGEYQQTILASPTTPTVSTVTAIHALSLTAGDWDVWANVQMIAPGGAGTGIEWDLSASATLSGVFPNYQQTSHPSAGAMDQINLGPFRFTSASPITVTLMARTGVAGTQINRSFIAARRRR